MRIASAARELADRVPASVRDRVASLAIASGTGGVLATAVWLEPAESGHGTHLQLGLNPCSFLSATGFPCPVCGATTTFTLWADLRPVDAIVNQPFASLLFWMTIGAFALSALEVLSPARRWQRVFEVLEPRELPLAVGFLVVMIASWIYKIAVMTP